ncbi:DNAJ1 [Symbiodinium sp. CCMP2592]|nr:DNAJ1 [Symbiodinium sp. CCMP2592]
MECGRGVPAAGVKAEFVPPCTAPTPTAPSPMPSPQIPRLEMLPDAHSSDVVLPLPVSLDQLYCGATRRVRVQAEQLKRIAKKLWQDVYDVKIPCGAPDGHRVTFKDKVCGGGDVVFVLQEMEHKTWDRQGCNLFIQQSISLREALLGCELVIEHLDGRRLLVRSKPGATLVPKCSEEDAGTAKTGDLESCKEICRRHGWAGFTYWEDKAYFRAQDRSMLLKHRRASRGSILFVRPQAKQMQHALLGYGMPQLGKPWLRGHLFVHLKVDLTDVGEKVAAALQALPSPGLDTWTSEDDAEELEEFALSDVDVSESQRQNQRLTGGFDGDQGHEEARKEGRPPQVCLWFWIPVESKLRHDRLRYFILR